MYSSVSLCQNASIHPHAKRHFSFILEDVQNIQCFVFVLAGQEATEPKSVPKLIFFPVYLSVKEACLRTYIHTCARVRALCPNNSPETCIDIVSVTRLLVFGPVKGPVVFIMTWIQCAVWKRTLPTSDWCGSARGKGNTSLTQPVLTALRFFFLWSSTHLWTFQGWSCLVCEIRSLTLCDFYWVDPSGFKAGIYKQFQRNSYLYNSLFFFLLCTDKANGYVCNAYPRDHQGFRRTAQCYI